MGSFNTTCFASGQTIAPGERCYVMPVSQSGTYEPIALKFGGKKLNVTGIANHTCYPNAFWEPYGGFIEAEYDDYGTFSLLDSPTNRLRLFVFFKFLMQDAAVTGQGRNSVHDVPFDIHAFATTNAPSIYAIRDAGMRTPIDTSGDNFFTECCALWDYVAEAISEHRVYLKNRWGVVRPLELSVMHHLAFTNAIYMVETTPTWQGKLLSRKKTFDSALDSLKMYFSIFEKHADQDDSMLSYLISNALGQIGSYEGMQYNSEPYEVYPVLKQYEAKTITKKQLFAAMTPDLDARFALAGLGMLNLRFSPMVYAGQDYVNDIGQLYAKFVAKTSQEVTAQRPPMDEDDEDEE